MNKLIGIIVLAVMPFAASADDKKKTAPAKAAAPAIQAVVIPKDAVENSDGSYSWADQAGKIWIFRKTPFGIIKTQNTAGDGPAVVKTQNTAGDGLPVASAAKAEYVKAIDNGDTVKFEVPTPFGTRKWEKKKSELTDEERRVFEQQAPKPEQKPEPQPE